MAVAIPLIGAAIQGIQAKNAADDNARIQQQEGTIAAAQGYSAEAQQRREGTLALGRETAAVGQSGGGYGGSAGRELASSAQQQEMDALSIRYKAGLAKWGYDTQSAFTRREGNDAFASGVVRAGTSLLRSYSASYSNPGSVPALSSGNTPPEGYS